MYFCGGDFFEEVNRFCFDQQPRFERPQFNQDIEIVNEEDVRDALNSNICLVLNRLMEPNYKFSRRSPNTTGEPHYLVESLILVIEVKRKHVLENINGRAFPKFYQADEKAKTVVQQIYNYMGGK